MSAACVCMCCAHLCICLHVLHLCVLHVSVHVLCMCLHVLHVTVCCVSVCCMYACAVRVSACMLHVCLCYTSVRVVCRCVYCTRLCMCWARVCVQVDRRMPTPSYSTSSLTSLSSHELWNVVLSSFLKVILIFISSINMYLPFKEGVCAQNVQQAEPSPVPGIRASGELSREAWEPMRLAGPEAKFLEAGEH